MISCVPHIYPDELFYSYMIRCCVYNGYRSMGEFFDKWTNPTSRFVPLVFPPFLKREPKIIIHRHLSDRELLHRHTLFDYYFFLCPQGTRKRILDNGDFLASRPSSIQDFCVPVTHAFKYCPLCAQEEREEFGEAYWHTEHQAAKVPCCVRHKVRLCYTRTYPVITLMTHPYAAEYLIPTHDFEIEPVSDQVVDAVQYYNDLVHRFETKYNKSYCNISKWCADFTESIDTVYERLYLFCKDAQIAAPEPLSAYYAAFRLPKKIEQILQGRFDHFSFRATSTVPPCSSFEISLLQYIGTQMIDPVGSPCYTLR